MRFIGHTRFSVFSPNSTAWVASNNSRFKTEEEYLAYLYSDDRMRLRMDIFINLSLPILARASVGYGLFHVISYSEQLPAKYEVQLMEAAQAYPFVVLNKYVNGHCSSNTHHLARRLYDSSNGLWSRGDAAGFYRLDDDDLLAVDFFRDMANYVRPDNIGSRVSLARGFTAIYRDGVFSNLREVYKPMIAIGLLDVGTVDLNGQLLLPPDVPHNRSDRFGAVIVDAKSHSFLWTRHEAQDTTLRYGETDHTLDDMNQYPVLVDPLDLTRVFPAPGVLFSNGDRR